MPQADDTRTLGIAISRLWLDGCAIDLDGPQFGHGWHARERTWRWTDGDAWLALAGARDLAFETMLNGTYWQEEKCGEARVA